MNPYCWNGKCHIDPNHRYWFFNHFCSDWGVLINIKEINVIN